MVLNTDPQNYKNGSKNGASEAEKFDIDAMKTALVDFLAKQRAGSGMLASLTFDNRFTRELPADPETTTRTRQVTEACYSFVQPTKVAAPKLVALPAVRCCLAAPDTVLNIIKRYKKGVDIPILKTKSGFNDKKVRNSVQEAFKEGKIK